MKRLTGLFTDIRRGEGITVILLMVDLFILLTAYLIIKTVREPLILISGGAEVKSYAAAGHVLLLLLNAGETGIDWPDLLTAKE